MSRPMGESLTSAENSGAASCGQGGAENSTLRHARASLAAQMAENLPAVQETWV